MLIKKWELPDHYCGAEWPEYYVGLMQHRDSDALTRSNFQVMLRDLGPDNVTIVREGHWAVGWIEWIAIHESKTDLVEEADEMLQSLEDYPVLDDEHFSELETEEADLIWAQHYDDQSRLKYIRENRGQFEFHDFSDLMGCVRGNYFSGYASELLQ